MRTDRRKRVNLSLDPETYDRLKAIQREEGFQSLPRMAAAILRVYMRLREEGAMAWDLPPDKEGWLDEEFGRLSESEREKPGYRKAGPYNTYTK